MEIIFSMFLFWILLIASFTALMPVIFGIIIIYIIWRVLKKKEMI